MNNGVLRLHKLNQNLSERKRNAEITKKLIILYYQKSFISIIKCSYSKTKMKFTEY